MTSKDPEMDGPGGITRRTLIRASGAVAGAAALGLPSFSRPVRAQSNDFVLYTITPSTQVYEGEAEGAYPTASDWRSAFRFYGIENQHLVVLNEQGQPQEAIPLDPQNVAGDTSNQVVQVATLSYNPADDLLYGIANQNYGPVAGLERSDVDAGTGRYVFTVDPTNGELNLVGGANNDLRYLWGSTWDTSGSTFYALESDASGNPETLHTVEIGASSTTVSEIGNVEALIGDVAGDDVTHNGLSWNKLAPQFNIVGILGNIQGTKDDLVEIDPDPLDARIAAQDVFSSGELVSTAFNPCVDGNTASQRVYSIRNGNEFFTADIDVTSVSGLGAITGENITPDPLIVTDNLAESPADCVINCTRTIGYWKNHPGCDEGPGKGKGNSDKYTIESVLNGEDGACGGFTVGTDPIYDGSDPATPDGTYDFTGDEDPCDGDVQLIVEALDGANAKDMDSQLLAQLLAAKLNVCNGATTENGVGGDITTIIAEVDEYFSCITDSECDESTYSREQKEMWKNELDGYNNQNEALSCEEEEEEE